MLKAFLRNASCKKQNFTMVILQKTETLGVNVKRDLILKLLCYNFFIWVFPEISCDKIPWFEDLLKPSFL